MWPEPILRSTAIRGDKMDLTEELRVIICEKCEFYGGKEDERADDRDEVWMTLRLME